MRCAWLAYYAGKYIMADSTARKTPNVALAPDTPYLKAREGE